MKSLMKPFMKQTVVAAFTLFAVIQPLASAEAATALPDGEYTIDYAVLKSNADSTSMMDSYTVKPASLKVEDGESYVSFALTSSDWITVFQTEQDGTYVDADVISENEAANTRVVGFPVDDLSEKLNAYTEVVIPAIGYNGQYNVRLDFDTDSITAVEE